MTTLWLDRNGTIPVDDFVPDSRNGAILAGAGTTSLATALLLNTVRKRSRSLRPGLRGLDRRRHDGKADAAPGTDLRRQHPQKLVNASVEANTEGQAWLLRDDQERAR
jgi:hypothetical protein